MPNIVLVGMRGAGKSNVSRRLSVMAKLPVLSTDVLVSYELGGVSIPAYLESCGGDWRGFRNQEYFVLSKLARLDNMIVDCGGGILADINDHDDEEVLSYRKLNLLRKIGTIVWLKGDIHRLVHKTSGDPTRPSLHSKKTPEQVMRHRLPFFREAAQVTIDIEGRDRKSIAKQIMHDILHEDPDEGPDVPGQ